MVSLYLSDILKKTELDLSEVLLIRHALSDKICKQYYASKYFKEYTQIQKRNFPTKYKYWITFIGNIGNNARLDKCYRVKGYEQKVEKLELDDIMKEIIQKKCCSEDKSIYFDIEESDLLNDLEDRLIIDWGENPRAWR